MVIKTFSQYNDTVFFPFLLGGVPESFQCAYLNARFLISQMHKTSMGGKRQMILQVRAHLFPLVTLSVKCAVFGSVAGGFVYVNVFPYTYGIYLEIWSLK